MYANCQRLGTVIRFQQSQVAERVLQRNHWLQGSQLNLVPTMTPWSPRTWGQGTARLCWNLGPANPLYRRLRGQPGS